MAELRRRKGDGDSAETADPNSAAADAAPATLVATAVDELLREKPALEPLQLSDSATADSSDHVGVGGLGGGS